VIYNVNNVQILI